MIRNISKVVLFPAVISLGLTGCVCYYPTNVTPTPTPLPTSVAAALSGTYSGSVNVTSTSIYNDGQPTKTTTALIPTTLIYNSSSVLTNWTRVLLNGSSVVTISNPQPGSTITYNASLADMLGVVTLTVAQANYTSTATTLTGTTTFGSGSTGYGGNGTFTMTVNVGSGGATYSIVHSWTIVAPGGTPVINIQENGSTFLPKS